jgi:hypothetical protein
MLYSHSKEIFAILSLESERACKQSGSPPNSAAAAVPAMPRRDVIAVTVPRFTATFNKFFSGYQ